VEQGTILSPGRFDGSYLTPGFVAERLAEGAGPAKVGSDYHLNPGTGPSGGSLRPASVLVPLIDRDDGLSLLLTRRTDHLAQHAGQIAFPGGRRESGDADEIATALRETDEELGLPPERIRVLGRLGPYVTRTGYEVTPVVGLIEPPFELVPDPAEVAEVFEVPLAFVVDPANHQQHYRIAGGIRRNYFAMPWRDRYIWGATAGMLVGLAHRLAPP
jgi:8-oxo-dGTP pyrophosphatase MutT (NUDIX family)